MFREELKHLGDYFAKCANDSNSLPCQKVKHLYNITFKSIITCVNMIILLTSEVLLSTVWNSSFPVQI